MSQRDGDKRVRYEAIANIDIASTSENANDVKVIKAADNVIQSGWRLKDYPAIRLDGDIPWIVTDPKLRSWNFRAHSLSMLEEVLNAYNVTDDLIYLKPALRVALDWIDQHPRDAQMVSGMAWYDMAVGMRVYRLAYIFDAARAAGLLSDGEEGKFWTALEAHRAELSDDTKIAFHNNHGYYQIAGQLALGRRFGAEDAQMQALYDQGVARFRAMLASQFSEEGVHREHSPDYHRMVLHSLKKGIIQSGLIPDPDLLAQATRIEQQLAWFVDPHSNIVNFGDSDTRSLLQNPAAGSPLNAWDSDAMQAVTIPGSGLLRPSGLNLMRQSGYAVVREPDPGAPGDMTRDSYLAQTAAFHSRTHKHADDLSFVWHDRGEAILVDAGRYGYIGKTEQGSKLWLDGHWYSHPMRVHMETTRAHNTLEFDGRNNPRKGVKPYGSAIVDGVSQDGTYAIETRCKLFGSIWRDRVLVFRPGEWLLVFDVFIDNRDTVHDVRQWFHTAPGSYVEPSESGYQITTPGGQIMQAASLLPGPQLLPIESGVSAPRPQGWWSGIERDAQPAPAFGFLMSGYRSGYMATLFSFGQTLVPKMERAVSSVTGRRFRVFWTDDRGDHRIILHRDEGLSLVDIA